MCDDLRWHAPRQSTSLRSLIDDRLHDNSIPGNTKDFVQTALHGLKQRLTVQQIEDDPTKVFLCIFTSFDQSISRCSTMVVDMTWRQKEQQLSLRDVWTSERNVPRGLTRRSIGRNFFPIDPMCKLIVILQQTERFLCNNFHLELSMKMNLFLHLSLFSEQRTRIFFLCRPILHVDSRSLSVEEMSSIVSFRWSIDWCWGDGKSLLIFSISQNKFFIDGNLPGIFFNWMRRVVIVGPESASSKSTSITSWARLMSAWTVLSCRSMPKTSRENDDQIQRLVIGKRVSSQCRWWRRSEEKRKWIFHRNRSWVRQKKEDFHRTREKISFSTFVRWFCQAIVSLFFRTNVSLSLFPWEHRSLLDHLRCGFSIELVNSTEISSSSQWFSSFVNESNNVNTLLDNFVESSFHSNETFPLTLPRPSSVDHLIENLSSIFLEWKNLSFPLSVGENPCRRKRGISSNISEELFGVSRTTLERCSTSKSFRSLVDLYWCIHLSICSSNLSEVLLSDRRCHWDLKRLCWSSFDLSPSNGKLTDCPPDLHGSKNITRLFDRIRKLDVLDEHVSESEMWFAPLHRFQWMGLREESTWAKELFFNHWTLKLLSRNEKQSFLRNEFFPSNHWILSHHKSNGEKKSIISIKDLQALNCD